MTTIKRTILFILCLGIAMGTIFGAGTHSQDTAEPTTETAGPADPFGRYSPGITYSSARTIDSTVRLYPDNPDMKSLEDNIWIRTYKEELGIALEYKWIGTDAASHTAKWNVAVAGGDIPDFGIVDQNIYKQLYDAGYIAEMDTVFDDYISPELRKIIPRDFIDQMTLDGKMYGFPLPLGGGNDATQLFIRKDWLEEVGLDLPKTFEDVVNAARAFQKANLGGNDTVGIQLSNQAHGQAGAFDGILNSFGAYSDIWIERDGSLIYSNTLPEWKDALLALQSLYSEGIINKDFAAIKGANVVENIAAEKAGIAYSAPWGLSGAINALHDNMPDAFIAIMLPPPAQGKSFLHQISAPEPGRIFVSARTKYPEAAVKIANLTWKLEMADYNTYCAGPATGGYRYKFMPWGNRLSVVYQDPNSGAAVQAAERNGGRLAPEAIQTLPGIESIYERYKLSLEGNYQYSYQRAFGPDGYYTNIYSAIQNNRIIQTLFMGLPTDTQLIKGSAINDEINMAIFDVIMGADYSTYERAIERWKANGGNQITQEVNAWYASRSK